MQKEEGPTALEGSTTIRVRPSRFIRRSQKEDDSPTLPIGAVVRDPGGDQYIIEGLLGQGGFGAVYLVRDRRFKRSLFALKEMTDPDRQDRERFLFEGEVLERLHHWALPHVYRVFRHQKLRRVYMLMDYIQGKNLRTLLQEQPQRCFSLPLVVALMAPIVDALTYLHQQDPPIVHCDIKPANIIMPERVGETMLVDFGLAKEYMAGHPTRIMRHGSPGYAAPEQYGSGTTPRTDIYGLAATFYTLLTGIVPVDAITRATAGEGIDPLIPASSITPDVPVEVGKTLQRAMSMSINDRFATVEEFWQALTAHAPEPVSSALPLLTSAGGQAAQYFKQDAKSTSLLGQRTPRLKKEKRQAWRRILLPILCVLILAGIVGGTLFWYAPGSQRRRISSSASRAVVAEPARPTPTLNAVPVGIAGTYKGTILDYTTNTSANIALKIVSQHEADISGTLTIGPNGPVVVGRGVVRGMIDSNGQVQFIASEAGGQAALFFQGALQSPALSGNFYSCGSVQGDFCNQVPGSYGTWTVVQAT